ncbi:MAG: hypothetical protein ABI618_03260 [Nitrospirota bacterium]
MSSLDEGAISDHTEFMVLALQLYDACRESLLGIASQNALGGECMTLRASPQESKGFSVLPGFGPAAEPLLFRQK